MSVRHPRNGRVRQMIFGRIKGLRSWYNVCRTSGIGHSAIMLAMSRWQQTNGHDRRPENTVQRKTLPGS